MGFGRIIPDSAAASSRLRLLTLSRRQARNALDMTLRAEMADVVAELAASTEIRALILTGAGEHFCAGGDLRSMSEQRRPPHASCGRVRAACSI